MYEPIAFVQQANENAGILISIVQFHAIMLCSVSNFLVVVKQMYPFPSLNWPLDLKCAVLHSYIEGEKVFIFEEIIIFRDNENKVRQTYLIQAD